MVRFDRGRLRPEKIHQNSPPFVNTKFPVKHEKNIHKTLLESRQSNILQAIFCKTPARPSCDLLVRLCISQLGLQIAQECLRFTDQSMTDTDLQEA